MKGKEEFIKSLETHTGAKNYQLNPNNSQKLKQRKKKVVAATFHGAGIVVPVVDDVGYRDIGESPGKIGHICTYQ